MRNRTIGDVVAEGKLKTFMDPRLIKAIGHPLREHILTVLNERVASPKEVGMELGLAVEDFFHHFEVLEELSFIERVKAERRRGATEHYFRATGSFLIDDPEWARVPATLKLGLSAGSVKPIIDDVIAAIQNRTFDARDDRHSSRVPAYLDEQGWHEVLTLLKETMWRAMDIRKRSARRLAESGEDGTPATVAILGFETPDRRATQEESPVNGRVFAPVPARHPASAR